MAEHDFNKDPSRTNWQGVKTANRRISGFNTSNEG
jgi:hypothetical protein